MIWNVLLGLAVFVCSISLLVIATLSLGRWWTARRDAKEGHMPEAWINEARKMEKPYDHRAD